MCPLQLLEVTKKRDTWAGWLASIIQHLAYIHFQPTNTCTLQPGAGVLDRLGSEGSRARRPRPGAGRPGVAAGDQVQRDIQQEEENFRAWRRTECGGWGGRWISGRQNPPQNNWSAFVKQERICVLEAHVTCPHHTYTCLLSKCLSDIKSWV